MSALRNIIALTWRQVHRPIYLALPAYLPSYVLFASVFDRVVTVNTPDAPPFQSQLTRTLARKAGGDGWDEETGLITLGTLPKGSSRRPRRPRLAGFVQQYLDENPHWTNGKVVFLTVPLDVKTMSEIIKEIFRRRQTGLDSVEARVLDDGVVDAQEVEMIRKVIYRQESGAGAGVDLAEAEFIFSIHYQVYGKDNVEGWNELFVEALTKHLLETKKPLGQMNTGKSKWLIRKLEKDGVIDSNELALVVNLVKKSASSCEQFHDFALNTLKNAAAEDGLDKEMVAELEDLIRSKR
jgi:hypothetical protein